MKIQIKPMSVNEAFRGRKFKTPEYNWYERELLLTLPRLEVKQGFKIKITFTFGMSMLSDIDNPVKPLLDILQKKYGFNDNKVYELHVYKEVVKKGNEFVEFKIEYGNEI